ncbi:hypothetical protein [Chryseobacterium potabilaquae]|uniref:Uncharacterized protein n=1 Tax=Chryseobacterium potabilaquae TaxID=2675057 RepID=A0A6N4X8M7_9FLAO|nr:hypothetical protein [Chryseobacterium potabilaquae]CAA7194734.1 hypothetical protein CHRY9293_01022 [Chryseobacterium potabilaquae]
MNNDKFQDKYDKIFQDMKEEKMEWDFEDFIKKIDGKKSEEEEGSNTSMEKNIKTSFPKWFWMAASIVLLLTIGFTFTYIKNTDIQNQAKLVENEVAKQKTAFIEENNEHQEQVAINNIDSISQVKKDSVFHENKIVENDVLDEILPKRGRLKKEVKPRFVHNSYRSLKDSTEYKDSYVIVNGKRIENVDEAINVTKYSFQVLANNVNEKLVQPKVINEEY